MIFLLFSLWRNLARPSCSGLVLILCESPLGSRSLLPYAHTHPPSGFLIFEAHTYPQRAIRDGISTTSILLVGRMMLSLRALLALIIRGASKIV